MFCRSHRRSPNRRDTLVLARLWAVPEWVEARLAGAEPARLER